MEPTSQISRVTRSKEQARRSYDRLSPVYDLFTGGEQKLKEAALRRLAICPGEMVLEIGPGTGRCLTQIAGAAGASGRVCAADLSMGMLAASRRRLQKDGLEESRVEFACADAASLPYASAVFDAVFMSFVLELFDTPEIPVVLAETRRILKPGGRLGVVSMANEGGSSLMLRLYEWLHRSFPQTVDCRPIPAARSVRDAGYVVHQLERASLFGLPVEMVMAKAAAPERG